MKREEIVQGVIEIVSEQLSLPDRNISLESRFVDDLNADSLDIVALVLEMEEAFQIQIPDEDIEAMLTVRNVVDYIENHKLVTN